jgi:hypothetical protein
MWKHLTKLKVPLEEWKQITYFCSVLVAQIYDNLLPKFMTLMISTDVDKFILIMPSFTAFQ